jgi:hypothetical protein
MRFKDRIERTDWDDRGAKNGDWFTLFVLLFFALIILFFGFFDVGMVP